MTPLTVSIAQVDQGPFREVRVGIPNSDDSGAGLFNSRGIPKLDFQGGLEPERTGIRNIDESGAGLLESKGSPKLDFQGGLAPDRVGILNSEDNGAALRLNRPIPNTEDSANFEASPGLGRTLDRTGMPKKSEKGAGFRTL